MLTASILLAVGDELLAACITALLAPHHDLQLPQRSGSLVRAAEDLQPAIILLDDSLDSDPCSLCLTLRRRAPHSKLLYLSSNWQPSLAAQLQAHGVDQVLNKPFAPQKLLDRLQALLEATPC